MAETQFKRSLKTEKIAYYRGGAGGRGAGHGFIGSRREYDSGSRRKQNQKLGMKGYRSNRIHFSTGAV